MKIVGTATLPLSAAAAATLDGPAVLEASSHGLPPFQMAVGLWAGSARFESQRDAMETACGQLGFAHPLTGLVTWTDAERMPELAKAWLTPARDGPFADLAIEERLGWVESMARDGGIPPELAERLRSLPLEDRFLGGDSLAGLSPGSLEWLHGVIPEDGRELTGQAAAKAVSAWRPKACADLALALGACRRHAWSQGRWMVEVDEALESGWTTEEFEARMEEDPSTETWIPLSMTLAMSLPSSSPFAALAQAYAQAGLTAEDRSDLEALAAEVGRGRLFNSAPEVAAELERRDIEQAAGATRTIGRGPLRT